MFSLVVVGTVTLLAALGTAGPVRTKTALDAGSSMDVEARNDGGYGSYGYVAPDLQAVGEADPDCNVSTLSAPPPPAPAASCNTGDMQCCNSVQDASSLNFEKLLDNSLLSLLPLGLAGSNTPVGVTCDPIVPIAGSSNQCNQQTVCCDNTSFQGLVALGCTPINVGL